MFKVAISADAELGAPSEPAKVVRCLIHKRGANINSTVHRGCSRTRIHYCHRLSRVVYGGYGREIGVQTKDAVECISLHTCLWRCRSFCGSLCALALTYSSLISSASIRQSVTHKLGDDIDVVRRAMIVRAWVNRRKSGLLSAIKAYGKLYLWFGALGKVCSARRTGIGKGRVDRPSLVVQRSDGREIRRNAEGSIESIGLRARLGGLFVSRCLSSRTRC